MISFFAIFFALCGGFTFLVYKAKNKKQKRSFAKIFIMLSVFFIIMDMCVMNQLNTYESIDLQEQRTNCKQEIEQLEMQMQTIHEILRKPEDVSIKITRENEIVKEISTIDISNMKLRYEMLETEHTQKVEELAKINNSEGMMSNCRWLLYFGN